MLKSLTRLQRLELLREKLLPSQAIILFNADEHRNEYVPDETNEVLGISGF